MSQVKGISQKLQELLEVFQRMTYCDKQKAKSITLQVKRLIQRIEHTLQRSDPFTRSVLIEHQQQAISLYGRCINLNVDSEVAAIAKEAYQMLLHPHDSVIDRRLLAKKIYHLFQKHRLSEENRRLLKFATLLMNQSSKPPSSHDFQELLQPICYAIAESLIATAAAFYHQHPNATPLLNQLDANTLQQINSLCHKMQITPEDERYHLKMAQVLILISDNKTMTQAHRALPTFKDLKMLFEIDSWTPDPV